MPTRHVFDAALGAAFAQLRNTCTGWTQNQAGYSQTVATTGGTTPLAFSVSLGALPAGPWFEWHFDRWELPPAARELARNDAASQAFVLRRNLAVQFHPEIDADGVQAWIDNGGRAELLERGIDPADLVASVRATETDAAARAAVLVDLFLDRVATGEL